MRLGFGNIEIEQFKSIQLLQFDFARGVGLHFITGRNTVEPRLETNGVGKSSLFDALTWCLYGKTVGGLRGPDILPWGGGRPLVATEVFIDGARHVVDRSHNPNKLYLDQHEATDVEVVKLVGMDHATLCHTLILGQGRPLFFDLPPANKLQLFADVLDLQRWDARSDKANLAARGLEMHNAAAERTLEHMRDQHTELGLRYRDLKNKSDQWETEHQALVSAGEARAAELRAEIAAHQPAADEASLQYDQAITELDSIRTEIQQLTTYERTLAPDLARLRHAAEAHRQMRSGRCPTCGQVVETRRKYDPEPLRIAAAKGRDLEQQIEALKQADAKFIAQRDAARSQLDLHQPLATEAQAKLTLIVDRLRQDAHEGNPIRPLLQRAREERVALKAAFTEAKQELAEARRKQARLAFWVKGFKDIKLHVIEQTLAELQITANGMLEQAGLIGWQLQFAAERETKAGTLQRGLNVFVQSPHNDRPVKWECWSGGEGQRLRVIGALALGEVLLNRAGIEPGLEVLDEPTDHLSPRGVQDMIDLLSDRAHALGRTILYCDQTARVSDRFASVLTVERTPTGTQLR